MRVQLNLWYCCLVIRNGYRPEYTIYAVTRELLFQAWYTVCIVFSPSNL